MFGGVYAWAAALLSAGTAGLLLWIRPALLTRGWLGLLDISLVALLVGVAIQLLPLPASVVAAVSPARSAYLSAASLQPDVPSFLPLTLDWRATVHAWLALFCATATFWIARAIFAVGGVRSLITCLAWAAIVVVLVAVGQAATGTNLVYGFWRPYDAGARPLGPFINRNHFGTWSLLVLFLCFGCLQWRRSAGSPSRGWSWRARVAHALDGRSLVLVLALVLLALAIVLGASRSTMLALACAAGYVAVTAPRGTGTRRGSLSTAALALVAVLAVAAYADFDRLQSRVNETRQLGLSQRVRIWQDTLAVVRDFPVAGAGAGNFSNTMRLYQTSDRTYFWNEAHNHYLQVAAEGGVLLLVPSALALAALIVLAVRAVRRRDDPTHWLRLGATTALVAAAVQSFWETGLTLPANGMLAAVAAALVVRSPHSAHAAEGASSPSLTSSGWSRSSSNAAARD
jgi:O-antigen ligase